MLAQIFDAPFHRKSYLIDSKATKSAAGNIVRIDCLTLYKNVRHAVCAGGVTQTTLGYFHSNRSVGSGIENKIGFQTR